MGGQFTELPISAFRIVGVIHLAPLPGTARGPSVRGMNEILESAKRDAAAWATGGADALIVENFGDVPFRKGPSGPETISAMTLAVAMVIAESGLPVGVNVLRNDVEAAVRSQRLRGGGLCAQMSTPAPLSPIRD